MSKIRYRVRHLTAYLYTGRVDLCHSLIHLTPRLDSGESLLSHRIEIDPLPDFQSEKTDYFGNHTGYFSIQSSHEELSVHSSFTLEMGGRRETESLSGIAWDAYPGLEGQVDESGVPLEDYRMPSFACPRLPRLMEFFRPSLVPGRDTLELADEIMKRIHGEFAYAPGATETHTPLGEVLKSKEGVCQDFAHVMIAGFRMLGIPARYISGYLETLPPPGMPKLQGADASHAWVEIFTPSMGWTAFDPTNRQRPGSQHIKLCQGRDYFDVQPLRGIFVGTGHQHLRVEVDVERM